MKSNNQSSSKSIIIEDFLKSFYVKALVDYNCDQDYGLPKRGLSFNVGDILLVLNANDEEWWSARRVEYHRKSVNGSATLSECLSIEGLIPSAERLAKKYRNRDNNVNFEDKTTVIESNGTLTSNKINASEFGASVLGSGSMDVKNRRKKAYMENLMKDTKTVTDSDKKFTSNDIYRIVQAEPFNFPRPIVVIGPGRNVVYDYLINNFPNSFGSPVNHTTRQRRNGEQDGIDYHFIENKDQFEVDKGAGLFVETVQFRNNWYGTSRLSVSTVMQGGRHCILDATVSVIDGLKKANLVPICLLICTSTYESARLLAGSESSEKVVKNAMQNSLTLNSRDRNLFDAVLWCNNQSELFEQVNNCITNVQRWGIWKECTDQTLLNN